MSFIGRALAGAAEVARPAGLQQARANIMAQRDQVLRQFGLEDREAEQAFRRSEREATQAHQKGIIEREREYNKGRYQQVERGGELYNEDIHTGKIDRVSGGRGTQAVGKWVEVSGEHYRMNPETGQEEPVIQMFKNTGGPGGFRYRFGNSTRWYYDDEPEGGQGGGRGGGPENYQQGYDAFKRANPDASDEDINAALKANYGLLPPGFTTEDGEPIAPPAAPDEGQGGPERGGRPAPIRTDKSPAEIVDEIEGNVPGEDTGKRFAGSPTGRRYGASPGGIMMPVTEGAGIIGRAGKAAYEAGDQALMRNEYETYKDAGYPVKQMPKRVIEWLAAGNGDEKEVAEAKRILAKSQVAGR